MARFSFLKKLLKGENALFWAFKLTIAHGHLLSVLRYLYIIIAYEIALAVVDQDCNLS